MGYGPFGLFGDGPSFIELTIQHWKIMGVFIGVYSGFYLLWVVFKFLGNLTETK